MKKIGILIALVVLCLCACADKPEENPPAGTETIPEKEQETQIQDQPANTPDEETNPQGQPDDGEKYIEKTLYCVFSEDGVGGMFDFIENRSDPIEKNLCYGTATVFRFIERDNRLVLKAARWINEMVFCDVDQKNDYFPYLNSGEYCSRAVAFLCDENAIRQCFRKHGIDDIKRVVIIDFLDDYAEVGYTIAAIRENDVYYMTVPLAGETYGKFKYQKIYTTEEFREFCKPQSAKVYLDGKEVKTSSARMAEYYIEVDIIDLLKAMGLSCSYNKNKKEIIANDYRIWFADRAKEMLDTSTEYKEFFGDEKSYDVYVDNPKYKNPPGYEKYDCGTAIYRDGRYLGEYRFIQTLCHSLGYEIELCYRDYSIHINKKEQK